MSLRFCCAANVVTASVAREPSVPTVVVKPPRRSTYLYAPSGHPPPEAFSHRTSMIGRAKHFAYLQ